jgi:D-arabinose 1-dehydrogenase-like Zn-dependent alcohol dehydrogenase
MGTRDELEALIRFCELKGVRPVIDSVLPLEQAKDALAKLEAGDVLGKIVLTRQ